MISPDSRCWLSVDLDAIGRNYTNACALAGNARVIPVLKADAYGHGAAAVAQALYARGARLCAVACASEAFALRDAGYQGDVLILSSTLQDHADILAARNFLLTLASREDMSRALAAAHAVNAPVRAHIKLDTGLHRLGFPCVAASINNIAAPARDPLLSIEGIYSHLALRNAQDDAVQHDTFTKYADELNVRGVRAPMLHLCDSIGMIRYPAWRFDAVRVGAYLYGNYPDDCPEAARPIPVSRFMTRVMAVRRVPCGSCLGYDGDHPVTRDSLIATLSAGYADGLPRESNRGAYALVQNAHAPFVGTICMDQSMLDVTDIPGVRSGDPVTLLGDGITLRDYAAPRDMNRNQATAIIGARVPRVYEEQKTP